MNLFRVLDFIHRTHLRDSKKHTKGFNFRCPYCQDRKRRAYLLVGGDKQVVYCHNCGVSTSYKKFIEQFQPDLYEEYVQAEKEEYKEKLKDGIFKKTESVSALINNKTDKEFDLKLFKFNPKYFQPVESNEQALAYCNKRKIPQHQIKKMYYNCHTKMPFGDSLIFPFSKDEFNYGFQARDIKRKFFYTFSKNESFKIYNIFNVDLEKPVYIFESIIDSLFKKNSVAVCGTSLSQQVLSMIKKPVWCLDNDKTGMEKALTYAVEGGRIFVMPTDLKVKDVNELVMTYGMTEDAIDRLIVENTFTGLGAYTKIKNKLRNKKW